MNKTTMLLILSVLVSAILSSCAGNHPDGLGKPHPIAQALAVKELDADTVEVTFKGFIVKPGGDQNIPDPATWDIVLCWGESRKENTKVVPYEGYYHGFRLGPLEKSERRAWNFENEVCVPFEVWTLTLYKDDGRSTVVERQKTSLVTDDYVILEYIAGPMMGADTGKLYEGSSFRACDMELYVNKVVRRGAVICNQEGEMVFLAK